LPFRFSVKICKAAFAKKIGPILVAAATAFNKYYKIVLPMRSLAYSVSREPFANSLQRIGKHTE
jgi:hypothetical protein